MKTQRVNKNQEYVSDRRWYGLAKRLERERLRAFGSSLSMGSIAAAANRYILEVSEDRGRLVREGWQAAMTAAAQADDFTRARTSKARRP